MSTYRVSWEINFGLASRVVRDAPFDIWGGGGARVFVACKLFFYLRWKTSFFLAINVRQFFFYVPSKKFFVICFPYYVDYVTIWCFFWSTYFSSISTTNFFFLPTFPTNFFFLIFVAKNYFFQFYSSPPPPPPQISNGASLSK